MTKREQLQQNIKTARQACKEANAKKLEAIATQRATKEAHKQARAALATAQDALVAFDNGVQQ